jgi:hypothetical protein
MPHPTRRQRRAAASALGDFIMETCERFTPRTLRVAKAASRVLWPDGPPQIVTVAAILDGIERYTTAGLEHAARVEAKSASHADAAASSESLHHVARFEVVRPLIQATRQLDSERKSRPQFRVT